MLMIIVALVVSFLIVIAVMPRTIRLLTEKGWTGVDVHKPDRPKIPKGGGIVVLFAIVTSLLVVVGITTFQRGSVVDPFLLAALVSILMAGMIGFLDDNLDFKNRTKIALPLLASIPMVAMATGIPTVSIPLIGTVNLGVLYPLVVVPLEMTFMIDATNMYAGMNGLEAGLASVNSSAVVVYVVLSPFFTGESISEAANYGAIVAASLFGASIAFLIFNRYPARILSGDVGNLPLGATIATAIILGNMDRLAVILFITYFVNFVLYIIYMIHVKGSGAHYAKFASPREDGTLEVVGPYTMYWILPYLSKKMTEKRNVKLLILLQALVVYVGIFLLLLAYPFGIGWL
jgi:UDP-N-acetylglucosamine--dolichyl-phosphate N-acetylglucosaminephosphotransferase